MAFTLKVQGLDRLQQMFHKLPVAARKELKNELKITAAEIRDNAKKEAPTDEARLKQGITYKETSALSFEIVAQTTYAGYLEFGTKSKAVIPAGLEEQARKLQGPNPGQGNPLEAITKWVQRKGIAGIYSVKTKKLSRSKKSLALVKQAAFFIWRSIKKFGINPQPYFFKQVPPAEQKLKARMVNFIKRII
jgi:HK97 gp10 family phage protein